MSKHARTQRQAAPVRAVDDRPRSMPRLVDTDPEDPSQHLDDVGQIQVGPMDIDARPAAEAGDELAAAMAENQSGDQEADDELAVSEAEATGDVKGTGDLYGVRIPHAADPDLGDPGARMSFAGAAAGETFFEALAEHSTELGPAPEEEVVIVDDSDGNRGHSPTESGDRPVADKGSGGPGGL
jgi:hypothetical protein